MNKPKFKKGDKVVTNTGEQYLVIDMLPFSKYEIRYNCLPLQHDDIPEPKAHVQSIKESELSLFKVGSCNGYNCTCSDSKKEMPSDNYFDELLEKILDGTSKPYKSEGRRNLLDVIFNQKEPNFKYNIGDAVGSTKGKITYKVVPYDRYSECKVPQCIIRSRRVDENKRLIYETILADVDNKIIILYEDKIDLWLDKSSVSPSKKEEGTIYNHNWVNNTTAATTSPTNLNVDALKVNFKNYRNTIIDRLNVFSKEAKMNVRFNFVGDCTLLTNARGVVTTSNIESTPIFKEDTDEHVAYLFELSYSPNTGHSISLLNKDTNKYLFSKTNLKEVNKELILSYLKDDRLFNNEASPYQIINKRYLVDDINDLIDCSNLSLTTTKKILMQAIEEYPSVDADDYAPCKSDC